MKKPFQLVLLLVLLALPVVIYLFLQMFGENKYGLAIFYEQGVDYTLDHAPERRQYETDLFYRAEGPGAGWENQCNFAGGQHYVPSPNFVGLGGSTLDFEGFITPCLVAIFPEGESLPKDFQFLFSELMRARREFSKDEMQVILIMATETPTSLNPAAMQQMAGWHGFQGTPMEVSDWANCGLVLPHAMGAPLSLNMPFTPMLTLIDNKQRVRGYYDGSEATETDRMILELRVLMQEEE